MMMFKRARSVSDSLVAMGNRIVLLELICNSLMMPLYGAQPMLQHLCLGLGLRVLRSLWRKAVGLLLLTSIVVRDS